MALSISSDQFIYSDKFLKFRSWFLEAADTMTGLRDAVSALGAVKGLGTLYCPFAFLKKRKSFFHQDSGPTPCLRACNFI